MPPLKPAPAQRRSPDSRVERTSRAPGRQTQRPRSTQGKAPRNGTPESRISGAHVPGSGAPERRTSQHGARPAAGASRPAAGNAAIPPEGERLNKYLARTGVCSRREADDWISRGWVHINGKPVVMGQKVLPGDRVEVKRAATQQQAGQVTILLNKPVGYVSGQAEDGYRPAVTLIRPENQWQGDTSGRRFDRAHLRGLAAAGRLDIDSVGLLVLTQDGRVARQLIGEDAEATKEYLVRVRYGRIEREVEAAFPRERLQLLRHGLSLDGKALKPAQVSWQNPEQLRFVLQEGRHRQIRRMCELVGLTVTGLKRIRMGRVTLGQLPPGQWRYLRADEDF